MDNLCLSPIFPDELVIEILSRLPVKPLLRFRSVSKPWNSLTSFHPHFLKLHLHRSPKTPNLILMLEKTSDNENLALLCSKQSLIHNNISSIVAAANDGRSFPLHNAQWCVGSCNGLVCVRGYDWSPNLEHIEFWVCFWNPALRLTSQNSPILYHNTMSGDFFSPIKFGFGYDSFTDTYKAVVMIAGPQNTTVIVHSMGDNCWKEILSFPPFYYILGYIDAEFLSGTLNWLVLCNSGSDYESDDSNIVPLVIFSLDFEKVAYKHLSLPSGLHISLGDEPSIRVLGGCLCLFHNYKGTNFVIWQMKEFGVEKSWTRLFNVNDQHLQNDIYLPFRPLCTSENGDVVVLANSESYEAILCNWKNNTFEVIKTSNTEIWWDAKDYVESFVLPG